MTFVIFREVGECIFAAEFKLDEMVNILFKRKPFTREWFRTYALLIGGGAFVSTGV